jgi:Uma2 family endonuclease
LNPRRSVNYLEAKAMTTVRQTRATLNDLLQVPEKSELIGGRIVRFMATGYKPSRVAFRIARSLDEHATQAGKGVVCTDNIGFAIPELPSGRESFSPDASYYDGPLSDNLMRFIEGPPTLAVEVRNETDYRAGAEPEMAEKRDDRFAAGTKVVWDVDSQAECIHVYRASDPKRATTYGRGELAEAEPAMPGWKAPVEWIFG